MWKEGGGISQRTCLNASWTWTRERGVTVVERGGLGRRGQKGKNWGNCNRIRIKKGRKKEKKERQLKKWYFFYILNWKVWG